MASAVVIAAVIRCVMLWEYRTGNPEAVVPGGDAGVYWEWAGRIAAGQIVDSKPFLSVPLYPYMLGFLRWSGAGLTSVCLVQLILHVCTGLLIARFVSGMTNFQWGCASVVIFFLLEEPAFLFTRILPSTLQLFLVACMLLAGKRFAARRSTVSALVLGLFVGLLSLTYPPAVMLVLVPPIESILIARAERTKSERDSPSKRSAIRCGLTASVVSVMTIAPATIHNWLACGEFIPLTAHAGITLRQGNATGAMGIYTPADDVSAVRERMHKDMARVYAAANGREGSYKEIDAFFRDRALRYIVDDIPRWGWLSLRKLYWFCTGRHYSDIYYPTLERAEGLAKSMWLAPIPTAWLIGPGFLGLWLAWRSRQLILLEAAMAVLPVLVVVVFWYSPRYRLPELPLLVMGVAVAAMRFVQTLAPVKHRSRVVFAIPAATLASIGAVWVNAATAFDRRDAYLPQFLYNVGQAYARQGDMETALAYYRRSDALDPDRKTVLGGMLELYIRAGDYARAEQACDRLIEKFPQDPLGWVSLGGLRFGEHRLDESVEAFSRALALDHTNGQARLGMWLALSRAGREDEGVHYLERAVELDPQNAMAHAEYGLYLARRGKLAAAESQWRKSLAISPRQPMVCFNLAGLLHDQGRTDEAVVFLRRALELDPGYDKARKLLRSMTSGKSQP